jgi:uncharacterized protein YaeQ
MALRSTIYKVDLEVSNLDRQVFDSRSLALARHPSETGGGSFAASFPLNQSRNDARCA